METFKLIMGIIAASLGLGYMTYGKKQHRAIAFICGVILIAIPYAISNIWIFLLVFAASSALPFIFKI